MTTANNNITWNNSMTVTDAQEKTLCKQIVPFCAPRHMHKLSWDLPRYVTEEIEHISLECGFDMKQTFNFRRGVLKCMLGMESFMNIHGNSYEKAQLISEAFESCLEKYMRAHIP